MAGQDQKLSFVEKAGYSAADAAANFVFMPMVLFQGNFYTDVFGLTATAAGAILLVGRLWDAFFDPIMGFIADHTETRWGKFRPWILFTAVPWCIALVLAYSTPRGLNATSMILYAAVTNVLLMTSFSANSMPYWALGNVMTGDVQERAKLNAYRFLAVNVAIFIVSGFTLPLVDKFAVGHDRQYGWRATMTIWAAICLVLFLITFVTTRERIEPITGGKSPPWRNWVDLVKSKPWRVMFFMTVVHFAVLAFRGNALYNYYHHYVDKGALYDWVQELGLTAPAQAPGAPVPDGILEWLGYIVHGDKSNLANSNVTDVANSIINIINTVIPMLIIPLSPLLTRRFGKKAVSIACFALVSLGSGAFYLLSPTNVGGMVALTIAIAIAYAPTIPLVWAIYSDVADYSEWKTGRRFTGIIFATIGIALKSGLALGGASFLWVIASCFNYDTRQPDAPRAVEGFRVCSSVVVSLLFAVCTVLLVAYQINKRMTLQMAIELAERRKRPASQDPPA
jgi:Na+/melibiose symporter-like transporter